MKFLCRDLTVENREFGEVTIRGEYEVVPPFDLAELNGFCRKLKEFKNVILCKDCSKRLTAYCPRMNTDWNGKWVGNKEEDFDEWYCADGEEKK